MLRPCCVARPEHPRRRGGRRDSPRPALPGKQGYVRHASGHGLAAGGGDLVGPPSGQHEADARPRGTDDGGRLEQQIEPLGRLDGARGAHHAGLLRLRDPADQRAGAFDRRIAGARGVFDEHRRYHHRRPSSAPRGYRLSNFPASAKALRGGSFAADALHGDDAERRFLVQTGFGCRCRGCRPFRKAWLVEVFGDSLTPELHHAQALLMALTSFALQQK